VRLLVVEDEVRLAASLRRGLTADGFSVDVATTGPEGLEAARSGGHDAVLLDIMLPGLSGYEVVRRLRRERNWVPVILMSAKDGEHDQADGLDCGADDYLVKPFSYVVLLARIRALFRRANGPRPAVLEVGALRLDPATRELTCGPAIVTLTSREFVLLEYLMRHPDRVVSKTELLDHVFQEAERIAPNAVEVYIGYLRRKLGTDTIVTVRGAGYRIST
jgi:two-component system, OmpR family, response regulator